MVAWFFTLEIDNTFATGSYIKPSINQYKILLLYLLVAYLHEVKYPFKMDIFQP